MIKARRALQVFLSYSRLDEKIVRDLYERLKKVRNIDAWFDKDKILGGQNWDQEVRKAIEGTDIVLVCISNKSISARGFFNKERMYILEAADHQPEGSIFTVPVRLDNCPIPELLGKWNSIDYYLENGFDRIMSTLSKRASQIEPAIEPLPKRKDGETWIVTGAAGFIGANLIRRVLAEKRARVVAIDNLTWGGSIRSLEELDCEFIEADISDYESMAKIMVHYSPTAVLNLAAESHVDRSIFSPSGFVRTNILGVSTLLDAIVNYLRNEGRVGYRNFRFLQASTDEIFGSIAKGKATERSKFSPSTPYAATKAAADLIVSSYHITYALPTLTVISSMNFGPFQFPEKLIPFTIINALSGRPIPIYGKGQNSSEWLHVEDFVNGMFAAIDRGTVGETYLFSGTQSVTNFEVVKTVCEILQELLPPHKNATLSKSKIDKYYDLIQFVADRPSHDKRYSNDTSKAERELEWYPNFSFKLGVLQTVKWYLDNKLWIDSISRDRK